MATTTNYGWTTPDDTALVKDGAAAIRTLGSSVDTTTKALNPETTLGDIAYRSSTANVKTRLGIGSTGQVLTVAAGVPSWATPAVSTPTFNGCRAYKNSYESIPNSTTTVISWDAEDFDTNSYHSNSVNNSRMTVPSTGYYQITGFFGWEYVNSGTVRYLYLRKNGSTYLQMIESPRTGSTLNANVPVYQGFTTIVNATAADYFELLGNQNSGGGLGNVSNGSDISYFAIQYLGA